MSDIKLERLTEEDIERQGIRNWPIWTKEPSRFDWHYDETEQCLILEGDVDVETPDGDKVHIATGDFVTFPKGLSCTWNVNKAVKKHYRFG